MGKNSRLIVTVIAALILSGVAAVANEKDKDGHAHAHADASVAKGYFDDDQIRPRGLTDWQGDWQSVYPLLVDGSLDEVMDHKAEQGDKTAQEYRAYYDAGYKTDVDRIVIDGDGVISFFTEADEVSARYAPDGHEILTYAKGNRGVRFIFEKAEGDDAAPDFIQFSDHIIAPQKSGHFHLYWGDDRAGLLEELSNWPTYYPAELDGEQIAHEMTAH